MARAIRQRPLHNHEVFLSVRPVPWAAWCATALAATRHLALPGRKPSGGFGGTRESFRAGSKVPMSERTRGSGRAAAAARVEAVPAGISRVASWSKWTYAAKGLQTTLDPVTLRDGGADLGPK